MAYAAVHLPEFPCVAWLRSSSSVRYGAVAVVEGTHPLEQIVSFNQAAALLGVEHGISKVQADMSGEVLFCMRSKAAEEAAFETALTTAERFTPKVQAIASPVNGYAGSRQMGVALLLDRTGTERLFGDAKTYAGELWKAFEELEFECHVATAPNAEASLLLARCCRGVTCVDAAEMPGKLAGLPVSALRCEDAAFQTLLRWGISTLGELAALPEAALVSRLGQTGKRLQRLAMGVEEHLLVPDEPTFLLNDAVMLDGPLDSLESLLFLLSPMLEKILKRATSHGYALRAVKVSLVLERGPAHELEVRPAVPGESKDLLLKLLNLKLQTQPPKAGILGARLEAEPAIPQVSQRGLFQAQFPEPDKLDLLIARLGAIVGAENVGAPVLVNSHLEDEFTMGTFAPRVLAVEQKAVITKVALRRFRPVEAANVVLRGAVPVVLFWKGERLELREATGPWESSGYWWDGRRWATEEWDVVAGSTQTQQQQKELRANMEVFSSYPAQKKEDRGHLTALRLMFNQERASWFVVGVYD